MAFAKCLANVSRPVCALVPAVRPLQSKTFAELQSLLFDDMYLGVDDLRYGEWFPENVESMGDLDWTFPNWILQKLEQSPTESHFLHLSLLYIAVMGILVAALMCIVYILNYNQDSRTGRKGDDRARPLILLMYWMNYISPPSHTGHDDNIYLTDTDVKRARPVLEELVQLESSPDRDITKSRLAQHVKFASDRDLDNNLILPSRTYPRQSHYQFCIKQHSLQKQQKNFGFATAGFGGRISTAVVTWMMHFSAGVANIIHSFMVVPIILFASEKRIRELMVKPSCVIFCKNEPKAPLRKDPVATVAEEANLQDATLEVSETSPPPDAHHP